MRNFHVEDLDINDMRDNDTWQKRENTTWWRYVKLVLHSVDQWMSGLCTPVLLFWSSRVAEDPPILLRKRRHSVTIAFSEPYKFA